ncbi:hypothetical protein [Glaciihabitans sp. UYNi722]|uniref:hypothetical protein n=1 Tax=Glaciihabitans sp. UYNi722 TaxID=3156344 RepID=UPI0033923521
MSATVPRRVSWPTSARAIVGNPIVLWGAFILAHFWLGMLNLYAPGYPLGDVSFVYKFWTDQAIVAHFWVGIDSSWVYPIVALVPMLMARVFGPELYSSTWLSLVMLLDAVALAFLTGWGRGRQNIAVGWWWVGFLVLLGPISLGRIDSITVPIAIVGVLLIASRPRAATVILTVATWIKVWPAAIIVAMVITLRDRGRIILTGLIFSLAIIAVALALGSGLNVFSFVTEQTGRGLQAEAPISNIWLWQAFAKVPNTVVYYDRALLTWQVRGVGVESASNLMTPLMLLVSLAIAVFAVLAMRNGATVANLLPSLSLAFVTAFIAFNKVGSPQYMTWLAVPVILGLVANVAGHGRPFRTPAIIVLVLAGLTQAFYPYLYGYLLGLNVVMLTVLSARNLLLFVLLGWTIFSLWQAGRERAENIPLADESTWLPAAWPFTTATTPDPELDSDLAKN